MKLRSATLILAGIAIVGITACSKEEATQPTNSATSIGRPKVAGPFVYRMHVHTPGCPTSGQGCSRTKLANIDSGVLAEFNSAIANGASGLQTFFTTGSWKAIYPGLDVSDPEAYARLSSGSYEGRVTRIETTTSYLFGPVGFDSEYPTYMTVDAE